MATIINPTWQRNMTIRMDSALSIDETLTNNKPAAWLVAELANRSTPFRVYNLGAGVKRITTDTDTCPCCRRKLT
jgi:hypothetical protein